MSEPEFMLTNTVDIIVGGQIYNSLSDLGLAIGNTDYLGSPVQDESNLVWVPGRSGPLDLTDSVFGEQYFSYRPISILFGGQDYTPNWDQRISRIRNLFEGKIVKLYFWTEQDWYWTGRVRIEDFEHNRQIGKFRFNIPYADPYKYKDQVITFQSTATGVDVSLPNSRLKVYPVVTNSAAITITMDGTSIAFSAGTHQNSAFKLTKCVNNIHVEGDATVTIKYTEGSL